MTLSDILMFWILSIIPFCVAKIGGVVLDIAVRDGLGDAWSRYLNVFGPIYYVTLVFLKPV